MAKICSLILAILLVGAQFFGQALPENGPVFLQNEVAEIEILIHPDSLALIMDDEDLYSNHEYPATFIYSTNGASTTVEGVGFRLRGNTSRQAEKKSLKVSFNSFESGADFYGLEKLNLNGEHNDPSLMRSKLCWHIYRQLGIPAPRASYVNVTINGENHGVYLNVEHIDEEFLERYFGHKYGNLYKCLYPADLNYLGSNPNAYKLEQFGRRVYDLKTNNSIDDYSDLGAFIEAINQMPLDELACELPKIFDVDSYLKMAATEVLTGHWDGYVGNKNNFYLFEDEQQDRLRWIPYDMDNTWGIDWFSEEWATRNIYAWSWESRPLYDRLLQVPVFRALYTKYLREISSEVLDYAEIENQVLAWQSMLAPFVEQDPLYPLDYGFQYSDFLQAHQNAWGAHVTSGILPYLTDRLSSLNDQLDSPSPVFSLANYYHEPLATDEEFTIWAQTGLVGSTVFIVYETLGSEPITMPMFDDGEHEDGEANDGLFSITISDLSADKISYQFEIGNEGESVLLPCEPVEAWLTSSDLALAINEWAPTGSSWTDEAGQQDDWLELFNATDFLLGANQFYLSDTDLDLDRAQLPSGAIAPNNWVLYWADEDLSQGDNHLPFKLKFPSETIYLSHLEEGALRIVDMANYTSTFAGEVQGRYPDGNSNISTLEPTPNESNALLSLKELQSNTLAPFPNPTTGILYFAQPIDVELIDLNGRVMQSEIQSQMIDLSHLPIGVYYLRSASQIWRVIKVD